MLEGIIMSAKWEKKEGNEGVLTVEVDEKKFDSALDQAFKKVSKDVQVPGFRKGKVPRPIFEQRFGVESLYQMQSISSYLKLTVKQSMRSKLHQLISLKWISSKLKKGSHSSLQLQLQ